MSEAAIKATLGLNTTDFESGVNKAMTSLDKGAQQAFTGVSKQSQNALGAVGKFASGFGVAGGVAAIALVGVINLAKKAAEEIELLGKQAKGLGIDFEELQGIISASDGLSQDQSLKSLENLKKSIDEGKKKGSEFEATFNSLGVKLKDTDGLARDTADVFYDVIDSLSKLDERARDAKALQIFGEDGKKYADLASKGIDDFKKNMDSALTITNEQAIAVQNLNTAFGNMMNGIADAGKKAYAVLAEILNWFPLYDSAKIEQERRETKLIEATKQLAEENKKLLDEVNKLPNAYDTASKRAEKFIKEFSNSDPLRVSEFLNDSILNQEDAISRYTQRAQSEIDKLIQKQKDLTNEDGSFKFGKSDADWQYLNEQIVGATAQMRKQTSGMEEEMRSLIEKRTDWEKSYAKAVDDSTKKLEELNYSEKRTTEKKDLERYLELKAKQQDYEKDLIALESQGKASATETLVVRRQLSETTKDIAVYEQRVADNLSRKRNQLNDLLNKSLSLEAEISGYQEKGALGTDAAKKALDQQITLKKRIKDITEDITSEEKRGNEERDNTIRKLAQVRDEINRLNEERDKEINRLYSEQISKSTDAINRDAEYGSGQSFLAQRINSEQERANAARSRGNLGGYLDITQKNEERILKQQADALGNVAKQLAKEQDKLKTAEASNDSGAIAVSKRRIQLLEDEASAWGKEKEDKQLKAIDDKLKEQNGYWKTLVSGLEKSPTQTN